MNRLRLLCCLGLLAAALAVVPGPAAASAATPPQAGAARACGTVKLTLGKSIVRARKVRCADARRFVAALLNRDCGETRDCGSRRFTFRGYRCVQRESDKLTKNSCTKGRKAISELHG
jgi:hypothetical protein